jgi:hypothetical protein
MKLFRKIDEQGYFIEDVLFESHPTIIVDEIEVPDPQYIDTPCDGGFYKPKWNGKEWVEGLTEEEIEEVKRQPHAVTESEMIWDVLSYLLAGDYDAQ